MAQYSYSTIVAVLLLLLSPCLLASKNSAKILQGEALTDITPFQSVVSLEIICNATGTSSTLDANTTLCSATVVQQNAVLTAASCFQLFAEGSKCAPKSKGVRTVNVHYTVDRTNKSYVVKGNPDKILIHDKYDSKDDATKSVNLAILIVDDWITLRFQEFSNADTASIANSLIAGWGPKTIDTTNQEKKLLKGHTPVTAKKATTNCETGKTFPKGSSAAAEDYWCVDMAAAADDRTGPCPSAYGGGDFGGVLAQTGDAKALGIMVPLNTDICIDANKALKSFAVLKVSKYSDWIGTQLGKHPAPSTGSVLFTPFLLGLLALVQFFLF